MTCPSCKTVNTVFTFDATKQDRCDRCCNYAPKIIKCTNCGGRWDPKCWSLVSSPGSQLHVRKPMKGIADEPFDI